MATSESLRPCDIRDITHDRIGDGIPEHADSDGQSGQTAGDAKDRGGKENKVGTDDLHRDADAEVAGTIADLIDERYLVDGGGLLHVGDLAILVALYHFRRDFPSILYPLA